MNDTEPTTRGRHRLDSMTGRLVCTCGTPWRCEAEARAEQASTLAALVAALRLYHTEHADECGCEACAAYDAIQDEVEPVSAQRDAEVARAAVEAALSVERIAAALVTTFRAQAYSAVEEDGWPAYAEGRHKAEVLNVSLLAAALRKALLEPQPDEATLTQALQEDADSDRVTVAEWDATLPSEPER